MNKQYYKSSTTVLRNKFKLEKNTHYKTVVFSDTYAFPKRHFNNQNYIALACADSSDRKPSAQEKPQSGCMVPSQQPANLK